jgi:hypothetical protein
MIGFVASWFAGVASTGSAECDGPCFDQWDEVFYAAGVVGVLVATATGLVVRSLLTKR